jgi:hypothetical protein
MDWLGVYNLTRLALLACTLVTAARWLLAESRRERLEAPGLRMAVPADPRESRRRGDGSTGQLRLEDE